MKAVGAHWIFVSYLVAPFALMLSEQVYKILFGKPKKGEEKSSEKKLSSNTEKNGLIQNGHPQNGKIDKVE